MSPTTAPSPSGGTEITPPTGTTESSLTKLAEAASGVPIATGGIEKGSKRGTEYAFASSEQDSLSMSLWLTCNPSWIRKFKQESPTNRSIMLLQLLEAFNDGVEGIDVSFSEP